MLVVCRDKIIFVVSNTCLWQQKSTCRDKHDKDFFATKLCLSRQTFCRSKYTFVAIKDVFCRDKHVFVGTKMMLVAAHANDSKPAAKSEHLVRDW